MRPAPRPLPSLLLVLAGLVLGAAPAFADAIRVVSTDDHGVTLRLDLPAWTLSPDGLDDGRFSLTARGLKSFDTPGRAQLPFASALIALPTGARATAKLVGGSAIESRDGVLLAIGQKSGFRLERGAAEATPTIEAVPTILDGSWPAVDVSLGEPFTFRRQRVVAIEIHPFRYDAASNHLELRQSITVRVDFSGAATRASLAPAPEDRFFEPVLRGAVLNYDQGRAWRGEALGARGSALPAFEGRTVRPAGSRAAFAFDESDPEVRVRIDSTGVWGLDYDELAARGFPAAVPDSEVSVHRHEFVEDQTVPYTTLELPSEVDDANGNGIFDSGDRIVVYVQSWASRSGASYPQRVWGDGEVVYATRVHGRSGLRVAARDGTPRRTGLTPLASYPFSKRFEKNFASLLTFPSDTLVDRFGWTTNLFYYVRPDTVIFETNQLDTTHAVSLQTRLMGRGPDVHVVFGAVVNKLGQATSLFDSSTVSWSGRGETTIPATLTGSGVSEGRFNHLVLWGKNDPFSAPDPSVNNKTFAGLDWFDLTYWRQFRPLSGYLECNSAAVANAPYELYSSTFADTTFLRAYDVTNPLDPRRMVGARREAITAFSFALRLQDSTGASRRNYVIFNNPKAPPSDHYDAVTRYGLENHVAGDYLLIVPEAFRAAVQPLIDLRTSQGMTVVTAPAEGIYDEFNGGRHSAYAIKRFIRYAYSHWNARFVLLAGDGAGEDPQNFYGFAGKDWIPTQMALSTISVFIPNTGDLESELQPADPWYVWCVDPACTDPSLAPRIHDLFLGRLPVNSATELASEVAKIVAYENVSADDLWRRNVLLFSDDEFSGSNLFGGAATAGYCQRNYEARFRQLNETIRSVIVDEAGLKRSDVEVFNEQNLLNNEPLTITVPCIGCEPDTCRTDANLTVTHARAAVTPALFTRLNAGRLWWNYQGHANEQVLSHESFYLNDAGTDDSQLYANDGRPFLFSAFSCHSNNFGRSTEFPGGGFHLASLGERMVTTPNNRGAIASWASVGYEVIPSNGDSHINVEMARAMFSNPPRDPDLSVGGSRVVLGEAIALALVRWVPQVATDPFQRNVGLSYVLLGDPATRLSIGSAQALVTANGDTVTDNLAVRLHTPGDTLRLEADLVSNQKIDTLWVTSQTDSGLTTLPMSAYTLTPAFPDTAPGGNGGRHYHLVYQTHLGPSSYHYTIHTIDRDGVAGVFNTLLPFQTVLRSGGTPINDGDAVSPDAVLSLLVLSPAPINDPKTELVLTLNGQPVTFDTLAVATDPSRREWILSWTHSSYPIDSYSLQLRTTTGTTSAHQFRVDVGGGELRLQNALAFPNPFDDDLGTFFSFNLTSGAPADVLIRVYTVTGRLIYSQTARGLQPGYHQLPWDGRDADGDRLANGIYVYRLVAHNSTASASIEGRLVKLRRPRRTATDAASTP